MFEMPFLKVYKAIAQIEKCTAERLGEQQYILVLDIFFSFQISLLDKADDDIEFGEPMFLLKKKKIKIASFCFVFYKNHITSEEDLLIIVIVSLFFIIIRKKNLF